MKYPTGINQTYKISTKNRGMNLEHDINVSNEYYLQNNIAVIYKKPTPINVVKVNDNIITKAYFKTPSTTDYNGLYQGKYIDFEAKETKYEYFPLKNIHSHQLKHLKQIQNHGGIAFIIVRFTTLKQNYLMLINHITGDETRITLEYFKKYGKLITETFNPRLDYLKELKEII